MGDIPEEETPICLLCSIGTEDRSVVARGWRWGARLTTKGYRRVPG